VDLTWQDLRRGDTLVICSDGLSGQVKREEIGQLVRELPDLDALCTRLITMANERGGPDNITVVAVRFEGEGLPAPERSDEEVGYHAFPSDEIESEEIPVLRMPARAPEPEVISIPSIPPMPEAPSPAEAPPPAPARRSGSPATIAAVGGGILLILLVLYFLLKP
jgi:protein phosphatase